MATVQSRSVFVTIEFRRFAAFGVKAESIVSLRPAPEPFCAFFDGPLFNVLSFGPPLFSRTGYQWLLPRLEPGLFVQIGYRRPGAGLTVLIAEPGTETPRYRAELLRLPNDFYVGRFSGGRNALRQAFMRRTGTAICRPAFSFPVP